MKLSEIAENCAECSNLTADKEDWPLCGLNMKEIPITQFDEGIIPKWCSLPEE